MPRSRFVHAAATAAAAFVFLLGTMSCSSNTVRGGARPPTQADSGHGDYSSEGDSGENAMATVEMPPAYEAPPPPPPEAPEIVVSDNPRVATPNTSSSQPVTPVSVHQLSAPATDTAAEGPDAVDNKPFRGLGQFNDPGVMQAKQWSSLAFWVGPSQAAIAEEAGGAKLTETQGIWMAPTMRVTLLPDPDLEAIEQTAAIQDIGLDQVATWKWKVKPARGGTYTLNALVEILVRGPDGELVKRPDGSFKTLDDFKREVKFRVRVDATTRAKEAIGNASSFGDAIAGLFKSWQGALAALAALIAAAGGVWAAVRKLKGGGADTATK